MLTDTGFLITSILATGNTTAGGIKRSQILIPSKGNHFMQALLIKKAMAVCLVTILLARCVTTGTQKTA